MDINKNIEELKVNINNIIINFKINISKVNNDIELINLLKIKYKNKIEQVSKISHIELNDNNSIVITPIEKELVKNIEDSIKNQKLDLSLMNMGTHLIILKQQLNKDKKNKIIKLINKEGEICKIKIRNLRRNILSNIKTTDKNINKNNIKNIEIIINKNILLIDKICIEKIKNL